MRNYSKYYLASLLLFVALPPSVPGQEQAPGPTTRQIRARKMADQWRGQTVRLILSDGQEVEGRVVKATFYALTIMAGGTQQILPLETIDTAIISPGLPEVLISILSGSLGVALGYGAVTLAAPNATTNITRLVAAGTGISAGVWGWRSFFREIRYDLKGGIG